MLLMPASRKKLMRELSRETVAKSLAPRRWPLMIRPLGVAARTSLGFWSRKAATDWKAEMPTLETWGLSFG